MEKLLPGAKPIRYQVPYLFMLLFCLGTLPIEKLIMYYTYVILSHDCRVSGYIYEVLVEFSYQNPKNAHLLVDYFNHRLQRHSAHGVLKTLKCVRQLVDRGSRNFRSHLRCTDEHVKRAPDFGCQRGAFTGTATLAEIRSLSAEILAALFEPAAVARDTSNDPEVPVCYVETFNIRCPRDFFI